MRLVLLRLTHVLPEVNLPEAYNFIKKETLAQVFSCEFCKILRPPFLKEHLRWQLLTFTLLIFSIWSNVTFSLLNFSEMVSIFHKKMVHLSWPWHNYRNNCMLTFRKFLVSTSFTNFVDNRKQPTFKNGQFEQFFWKFNKKVKKIWFLLLGSKFVSLILPSLSNCTQ